MPIFSMDSRKSFHGLGLSVLMAMVSATLQACAPVRANPSAAPAHVMDNSMQFDFTEDEMYRALVLVVSENDAREQAREFARAYEPGMDWGTSEQMLLLLSLASAGGQARVDRLRGEMQQARREGWIAAERRSSPGASDDELARRWAGMAAAEEQAWQASRAALRRTLQEQGKLPPDTP